MLPALANATTTAEHRTNGQRYQCPVAYTPGMVIGATEAAVLQSALERCARRAVVELIEAEQAAGRVPTAEAIQAAVTVALQQYNFGLKRPSRQSRRSDPLEPRILAIAYANVVAHLQSIGGDLTAASVDPIVDGYVRQHRDALRQLAQQQDPPPKPLTPPYPAPGEVPAQDPPPPPPAPKSPDEPKPLNPPYPAPGEEPAPQAPPTPDPNKPKPLVPPYPAPGEVPASAEAPVPNGQDVPTAALWPAPPPPPPAN